MASRGASAKCRSGRTKQLVCVDFAEQRCLKEEFRPDLVCSLCRGRGSFVIVWPESDARVFVKHGLCEACLRNSFDLVMQI